MGSFSKFSSPGLEALLKRNGIRPTGLTVKDIELARKFMPSPMIKPQSVKK